MENNVVVFAHFDLKNFKDPESNYYSVPDPAVGTLNNVSENIVLNIKDNNEPDILSFSSNGIDGTGYSLSSFNINKINYVGQKIYFTVKYKSNDMYDVKSVDKLTLNGIGNYNLTLTAFQGDTVINLPFEEMENNFDGGGIFRGFIIFDRPATNIKIKGTSFTGSKTITGESSLFNVYPVEGLHTYRKINEDNDQKKNYKDLRFQNILSDKDTFFNNFLGTIVGDASGSPDNLGIKIYEKIANFTKNNSDINYSNLKSFFSQMENLDIDFEKFNVNFPPNLQRIVDFSSINLSLQKGAKNNFNLDFDDKGYIDSDLYGVNKGKELDLRNFTLSTGMGSIIAYEKFSENYSLLNTNLISAYDIRFKNELRNTFSLSSYDEGWGWGLILPNELNQRYFLQYETNNDVGENNFLKLEDNFDRLLTEDYDPFKNDKLLIKNYYNFYLYKSNIEGSQLQKFIDYDNVKTSVGSLKSFKNYSKDGGFIDELVTNNLLTNTGLVTSNSN